MDEVVHVLVCDRRTRQIHDYGIVGDALELGRDLALAAYEGRPADGR
jgi:hypothetical protein